ncbi:MAG: hypothetical protein HUU21_32765 [Polyangiaceae bacterium]|nr:choice-of-anchor L domain-containing protein [Polyangiaceae bacterium]NUQ78327.1 hypothetical protein [Polyangiaceae bacterium]
MKRIAAVYTALLCFGFGASSHALTVNPTSDSNVLSSTLLGAGTAVTISSAVYAGAGIASATYSGGPLGIADGILLTSGDALFSLPPSDSGNTSQNNGLPGDPLCDALIPGFTSFDATKLTIAFDLAAGFDGISFQFIFGSEEYPEFVGSSFNDVVGVYLDGVQVAFDDDGNPITINGPFFSGGSVIVEPATETEYDGSTSILTTQAPALPGPHILEIVICDAGDMVLDSGVFMAGLNGCVGANCTGTLPCELIDNDGDGATSCDDCDDADSATYPGATEVCDGKDNNCDGAIDEGNVCCVDPDGDGVCDPADNCPGVANPDQANADGDLLGDACDDCPFDAANDADGDGVCGDADHCPGTVLPEGVPTVKLGVNRFADTDGDGIFNTVPPKGKGPCQVFTIEDTGGCSCEQIIEELNLGQGHVKFGCSLGVMKNWISSL